jgi:hypothetical protein
LKERGTRKTKGCASYMRQVSGGYTGRKTFMKGLGCILENGMKTRFICRVIVILFDSIFSGIIFTLKKADCCLVRMVGEKVLSVIRCWKNGAILSVDNLELSLSAECSIFSWFSGNNFDFPKVPGYSFSGMYFGHSQMITVQEEY